VREVAPGIYSLGHGKGGHVHAFLVDQGGELTLVDTLFETDARLVLYAIHRIGRRPGDLKRIAITHGHRSHLGGLATLAEKSRAKVFAHAWEADIVSGDRAAQGVSIVPRQSLKLFPFQLGLWLGRPKHRPCGVDELLADGDSFGPFEVIHAAGHSPGHLAFWWSERRFLIAGDAVATWPELCAGWHAFNLNKRQHHASLQRLSNLEPSAIGVGHGEPITQSAKDVLHEVANKPVPR
jgi:glyoxylase-like metal-dependent hydrolase (beta-lactamase superfamily II)